MKIHSLQNLSQFVSNAISNNVFNSIERITGQEI